MGFGKWCVVSAFCMILLGMVQAQEIELELQMPGSMFGPGSSFSLDLLVTNAGPALNDAQLFIALTIGSGDFWFYPGWVHYPPDIDWDTVDLHAQMVETWEILPHIFWPSGSGAFEGAMFFAAILHNGMLMSNLADVTFGWTEQPVATVTPTQTPTQTPTRTPTRTPTHTPTHTPTGVYIPPGSFTMGSPSDEPCRFSSEGPQHQVTLTRGFNMMTTEVTRQMWADLKAVQPTLPDDPSDITYSPTLNHPVQQSTCYESILFANLMSVQDGFTRCYYKDAGFATPVDATNYTTGNTYCNFDANGYRLPTEAEWEYACRAGTTGPFSAHEPNFTSANCNNCSPNPPLNVLDSIAWWCGNSGEMTRPVGTKLSNPLGLYDMHGNVWEWCWDWWYDSYPSGPVTDPTGPSAGSFRVIRGGCRGNDSQYCRSAYRGFYVPVLRNFNQGFRLLRTTD